jgi:hypothetical protein
MLTSFWFFFNLEDDDSNDKRPSSSQEDNAEDEPEGETDKQELVRTNSPSLYF